MKGKILSLLILISLNFILNAQTEIETKIDNLKTENEVENFIKSFNKKRYKSFSISNIQGIEGRYRKKNNFCKNIANGLNITKSFYKEDFDQNGRTDILVIGNHNYELNIFIAMNFGKDSLKLYRLTRGLSQNCVVPEISKIKSETVINYYYKSSPSYWRDKEIKSEFLKKVLVYKFGDFIEYNESPPEYSVEKIEYQTTGCEGTCPVFNITIDKNKKGTFNAWDDNRRDRKSNEINGEFKTIIKENEFNNIVKLLNYIDFPKLKDDYAVSWTDDQSCTLTITYNNGKVKKIKDYGLIGTFGLDILYNLIFELRFNQEWVEKKSG